MIERGPAVSVTAEGCLAHLCDLEFQVSSYVTLVAELILLESGSHRGWRPYWYVVT